MGLFGGKSILGKISRSGINLGSVGESLNDITGVASSARQQYKHQLALQKDAQEFSKWQMQNAHQMEVQDLQKAGLNPVLSAGAGGGASAGVSMGSASAGTGAGDPISMIAGIVNMSNSVRQTDAQVKKADADVTKALAEAGYTQKQIDYYLEHGVFPGATVSGGALGVSGSMPVGWKGVKNKTNSAKKTKEIKSKAINGIKDLL